MELMHPYRVELDHFQIPKRQLESAAPIVSFFSIFASTFSRNVIMNKAGYWWEWIFFVQWIHFSLQKYKSLDDMTLVYINTKEGLESFRDILNNEKEFAVDLEVSF